MEALVQPQLQEGWNWVDGGRRWHYFVAGTSLCLKYAYKDNGLAFEPETGEAFQDECKACRAAMPLYQHLRLAPVLQVQVAEASTPAPMAMLDAEQPELLPPPIGMEEFYTRFPKGRSMVVLFLNALARAQPEMEDRQKLAAAAYMVQQHKNA